MQAPGKFITFEGLDGCGKTTQLDKLAETLRRQGLEVVVTREPGGTEIGERIRSVLLDSRTRNLASMAELALMFASRAQQLHEVIVPAVRAGKIVLCDRFTDSSEAYQGGGRELGSAPVLELHQVVCRGIQPDLTILLVTDVNASVNRARRRNEKSSDQADENRFEMEDPAFYQRVYDKYMEIAQREPERVVKVEAQRSIADIHEDIMSAVRTRVLEESFTA